MYNYCTIVVAIGFLKQIFINPSKEPKGHSMHTEIQDPFPAEICVQLFCEYCMHFLQDSCKKTYGVFSCSVSDYGSVPGGHSFSSDD